MKAADLEPGMTLYVRANPGLPNGRRSRGGHVFTDASETELHVVPNGTATKHNEVSVSNAGLILEDKALAVSDEAAFDVHADHHRLSVALEEANERIAEQDALISDLRQGRDTEVVK